MLLGLPSQMGIKVNLDLTKYISFNLSSTTYHLHYSPMLQTMTLKMEISVYVQKILQNIIKTQKVALKKKLLIIVSQKTKYM